MGMLLKTGVYIYIYGVYCKLNNDKENEIDIFILYL